MMRPSVWAERLLTTGHRWGRTLRRDWAGMTPAAIRTALDTLARLNPGPASVRFEMCTVSGVPVAAVTAGDAPSLGRIVLAHGGGFAFGSPRTHRAFAAHLALESGWEVWLPDYPLTPESPFPAAVDALRRVWDAAPRQELCCVVAGDSAGGNLATALVQRLLHEGMPVPDALLLFSPWLDLARDSESNRLNLEALSPFDRSDMETYGALYAGAVPFEDPRVSPLRGSVAGFPPVFIESSEVEYLRPDAQAFVAVLKQAGVAVEERTEAFALHGWQLFPDLLPEAQRSVQAVGEFLRRLQPAAASRATVRRGNASARSSSVKVSGGAKRTA